MSEGYIMVAARGLHTTQTITQGQRPLQLPHTHAGACYSYSEPFCRIMEGRRLDEACNKAGRILHTLCPVATARAAPPGTKAIDDMGLPAATHQ